MSFPIFSKYYKDWISIFSHDKKLMCLDFILQNHCYCSCQNCKPDTLLLLQKGEIPKIPSPIVFKKLHFVDRFKTCLQKSTIFSEGYHHLEYEEGNFTWNWMIKEAWFEFFASALHMREAAAAPPKTEIFRSNYFFLLLRTTREFPQKLHSGQLEQEPKPPEWGGECSFGYILMNASIIFRHQLQAYNPRPCLVMAVFICRILKCLCNSRVVNRC